MAYGQQRLTLSSEYQKSSNINKAFKVKQKNNIIWFKNVTFLDVVFLGHNLHKDT
jgi:hypothetical protein